MYIFLSPQRDDNRLEYRFDGNNVTVTYNEELSETFDITNIHDHDEQGEKIIKPPKILPVNPIISVKEKDGELYVRVLRFHSPNPPHDVAWPDWIEVEDGATYPNN